MSSFYTLERLKQEADPLDTLFTWCNLHVITVEQFKEFLSHLNTTPVSQGIPADATYGRRPTS